MSQLHCLQKLLEQEVQTAEAAKGRAGKADESRKERRMGGGAQTELESRGYLGERCPAPTKCHLKGLGPLVA